MIHSTQSGWVGQKVSVDISSNDSTASAEFSFKTKCRNKSKLSTFTSKTTTTSTPPLGSRNKIFVLLPPDWDVFYCCCSFAVGGQGNNLLLAEWPSVALFECGPERTWVQIPSKVSNYLPPEKIHFRILYLPEVRKFGPKRPAPFYHYPAVLIEHC